MLLNNRGDNNDSEKPKDWLELWQQLFEIAYGLKPKYALNPQDALCASKHFLATQISSIDFYDTNNNRTTLFNLSQKIPESPPKRIVAKLQHIEIEYIPSEENQAECIKAIGFKHDLASTDLSEANNALKDKIASALSLAYMAKANGWTKVDFAGTNDPIDRMMLIMACRKVGLDYGEETAWTSSVDDTLIDQNSYIQENKFWENVPTNKDLKNTDNIIMHIDDIVQNAFTEFTLNQNVTIFSKGFTPKQPKGQTKTNQEGPVFLTGSMQATPA